MDCIEELLSTQLEVSRSNSIELEPT